MKNIMGLSSMELVKHGLIALLIIVLISSGSCSKDKNQANEDVLGEFNAKCIKHEGIERTYGVYLPNNFNKGNATPMVLALHGGGGTGSRFEIDVSDGSLTAAAESRGMVIVTPDGIDKRWNDGRTEHFGNDRMYDDVGFIAALIDRMVEDYGVDPNGVYATGISNGGLMSFRLALDLSNKITAIAPVTAQISKAVESKVPDLPVSLILVNGVEDPLVPYDGGCINNFFDEDDCRGEVLSTDESIVKFLGFNKCATPGETEAIIDQVPNDGTSVEITNYKSCEDGTEVVLVKVTGGGHTWPGGAQYLPDRVVGKLSKEINASEMILDFFLNHSRN
ncbi:esterase [Maribacter algarum]|uniref:Esterase n=1 Tax=Maribacter algarum (ex Zhang et al. 2020) TaxID=2578118 RepID=A0A5S3PVK8_9FLAO|nr:PHB depolymerase family esterase [Maribacter algarum]TMM59041.1 esterase [Maribacter algarum]